jgi:hypothetical protein
VHAVGGTSVDKLQYPQGLSVIAWEGDTFVLVCDAANHMMKLVDARTGALVRHVSVNTSEDPQSLEVVSLICFSSLSLLP